MKIKLLIAASAVFAVAVTRADAKHSNVSAIATGALAESCAPNTVFIPVTQNVTVTETMLYSAPPTDLTTVLFTTVPATTTVTAGQSVPNAALSSSSGPPYTFSVVDSSTLWEGGISPISGAQLSVATSIVTLTPIDATATDLTTWMTLTSTSTVEKLTTITLPATTSTTYSMLSTILTTTLTSTKYITYSLSEIPSRSAFSGVSSAGWNVTTMQPTKFTPVLPAMTTLTETHYYGSGNITTSTSTNRTTTTLGAIITTTLVPPASVVTVNVPGAPLYMTTVTAAPVTVTYTVHNEPSVFSTSVSFSSVQSSTLEGAESATISGGNLTVPTISITSGAQPGLPQSYTTRSALSLSENASISHADSLGPSLPTMSLSSGTGDISAATSNARSSSSDLVNVSAAGSPSQSTALTVSTVKSFLSVADTTLALKSSSVLATPKFEASSTVRDATPVVTSSSGIPSSSVLTAISNSVMRSSVAAESDAVISSRSSTTASWSSMNNSQSSPPSESASIAEPRSSPSTSSTESPRVSIPPSSSATKLASVTSQNTLTSKSSSLSLAPTRTSNSVTVLSPSSPSQSRNGTVSISALRTTSSSMGDSLPVSSATSAPTRGCGEQGNFTMDFDDLPTFHPGRSTTRRHRSQSNGTSNGGNDITRQPPLDLRPYHHLTFSNGFVYAPQLVEPFAPVSQPNVAAFLADGTGVRTGGRSKDTGEIGDGPAPDDVSAFWFDAYTAFFGCDNAGPDKCNIEVTGLHWDPVVKNETPAFAQNYTLPPCPGYRNCALTPVTFPSTARSLSGLEIRAIRNGEPRMFFMDDMHMAWSNKTCDAGMLRQQTQ